MRAWLLLLGLVLAAGAQAEEKINSFHSDIRIAADGWLTVTETIAVQVEGRQIQRGILRDFPTDYVDWLGRRVTVPFQVRSVRRDGVSEQVVLQYKSNGSSLRIGNPSKMLAHGEHVYEIVYRTRFQLGFFDRHDELYWNVNGNGWSFAMEKISATVHLPQAVPASDLKVEAYTGPPGSRGRDYSAQAGEGGAEYRTTRRLPAGEGFTVVFMFPKGVVAAPTLRDRIDRWLDDNLGEAFGLAGALVLLSFLYWRWSVVGRDPSTGPAFPRYEAPPGFGPGGVRYFYYKEYDDRCFTAAVLGLAQRGFMRITENEGNYSLERTGKKVAYLPGDAYVAALVPEKEALNIGIGISTGYNPNVAHARRQHAWLLAQELGAKYFALNRGPVVVGTIFATLTWISTHVAGAAVSVKLALGLVMAGALVLAWKHLPAYTPEGRKRMDEIEGLRQYLSVAEKDDLAREKRPPRTREEFARFLPYAVALNVEKTWGDAFATALGATAVAAAVSDYYSSSSGSSDPANLSSGNFANSFDRLGESISSASTPPGSSSGGSSSDSSSSSSGGSSSSSGGGSSGGGGGGGGGSGW